MRIHRFSLVSALALLSVAAAVTGQSTASTFGTWDADII
jgi:hypothetical protein